jgi:hypothetical protein
MKNYVVLLAFLFSANFLPQSAIAGPASESLGTCMIDSLTGKERKQLAQWVFFAMAAHPEIKEFSKITAESQLKTNETVGKLVTRLLTENCAEQVKKAAKEDGPTALSGAFELVGKVAMQELMANKEVVASISGYAKFVDQEKLGALMKPR